MPRLLLLTALGATGCLTCTLMYAPSTLTVLVQAEGNGPGRYAIEASGNGQNAMCVVDLPLAEGDEPLCTDNAELVLDDAGERIEALRAVGFAPSSVHVVLRHDGAVLADEVFTPDYAVDEPNGQGCGERFLATVVLAD